MPAGAKIVAEYWLQTADPSVIIVFETDNIGHIMAASAAWADVFEISVCPAVTAEEGLQMLQTMMP